MATFDALPCEILFRILSRLDDAADVESCARASARLAALVARDGVHFARSPSDVWLALRAGALHVRAPDQTVGETTTLRKLADALPKSRRVQAASLTIDGGSHCVHASTSAVVCTGPADGPGDRTSHNDEADDDLVAELCDILQATRQIRVSTLVLKDLRVTSMHLCDRLLAFAAQRHCRQVVLKNCELAREFTPAELARMPAICQYTASACTFGGGGGGADLFLRAFNRTLRYGVRRPNAPFFISAAQISPDAVVDFLNDWIHISEASFFEIRVENCDADYVDSFLNECTRQRLRQVHLEFPSRAHPTAHVKAKYNPDERLFQMFPIVDVPARSYGQTICYARHFRDF